MSQDAQQILVDVDGSLFTDPPTRQDTESSSSSPSSSSSSSSSFPPTWNDSSTNFTEDEIPMDTTSTPSSSGPKGTDPAIYLILTFAVIMILYYLFYKKNQKKREEQEAFFRELDGDKFHINLPTAVDEYYQVKEKCEDAGWTPGKVIPASTPDAVDAHTRLLAQALMKRCIADIPLITHLQKESAGMNKLYSQSMCSVKQWKSYQAAEALISTEVEEVRVEADEIEPGWSQLIWKQAMQYHAMLKNRQEMEAKAAAAAREAQQQQQQQQHVKKEETVSDTTTTTTTTQKTRMNPDELKKKQEEAAEKAAQELIQMEEQEKEKKKSFSAGSGMKKGFLESSSNSSSKTGAGGSGKKKSHNH